MAGAREQHHDGGEGRVVVGGLGDQPVPREQRGVRAVHPVQQVGLLVVHAVAQAEGEREQAGGQHHQGPAQAGGYRRRSPHSRSISPTILKMMRGEARVEVPRVRGK